jgi:hypothetical protein
VFLEGDVRACENPVGFSIPEQPAWSIRVKTHVGTGLGLGCKLSTLLPLLLRGQQDMGSASPDSELPQAWLGSCEGFSWGNALKLGMRKKVSQVVGMKESMAPERSGCFTVE